MDYSMTSTGIAAITNGHVDYVRRIQSKPTEPTLEARGARLRNIARSIVTECAGADLIVYEGPAYAANTGSAHDRSGGWWVAVAWLTGSGLRVVEVPPNTLKQYTTGKGNAAKDAVLAAQVRRYPHVLITGNDEADALGLASLGSRHLGFPVEELPEVNLRALRAVKWNDQPNGATA